MSSILKTGRKRRKKEEDENKRGHLLAIIEPSGCIPVKGNANRAKPLSQK